MPVIIYCPSRPMSSPWGEIRNKVLLLKSYLVSVYCWRVSGFKFFFLEFWGLYFKHYCIVYSKQFIALVVSIKFWDQSHFAI